MTKLAMAVAIACLLGGCGPSLEVMRAQRLVGTKQRVIDLTVNPEAPSRGPGRGIDPIAALRQSQAVSVTWQRERPSDVATMLTRRTIMDRREPDATSTATERATPPVRTLDVAFPKICSGC